MIFISSVHTWAPRILSIFSLIFNCLFCLLVFFKSSAWIGGYRYLLITFSSFNVVTTLTEMIVSVTVEGFNHCFIVFMPHGPFFEYKELSQLLISIRCSMCAFTFAILAVHFVYRFFAICRPHLISHFFYPLPITIIILLVTLYGSSWIAVIFIFMWPDDQLHLLVNEKFKEVYNMSSFDIPMILAAYDIPLFELNSGKAAVGLASIVTIFALILYIILALRIHYSLKTYMISSTARKLHRNLLTALVLQTIVPLVATIIPCFIVWGYPITELDLAVEMNSTIVPFLSAYPAIDPIVIIFVLTDYRRAAIQILRSFAIRLGKGEKHRSSKCTIIVITTY